jgi:RimJ/RimL family protein N-acetyltransferase
MKDKKPVHIKVDHELHLRTFKHDDKEKLIKYANNRSIWINLMDGFPHPYSIKDAKKWISFCLTESKNVHLAIIYKNELVGAIGAQFKEDIYRYSAELGYWVGEPFWGKGIATRVIKSATTYLFNTYKINRIYASTFPKNIGSNKVLLKNGFIKEGVLRKAAFKDGFFIDLEVFGLLKED